MGPLLKLLGAAGAVYAFYELRGWWRKKHATTPMVPSHAYTVVVGYSGVGVGGPISGSDLQSALDAGPAGAGTIRVQSTATDPQKKTITYGAHVIQPLSASDDMLAPPTIPSPFGRVELDSVHDAGIQPLGPVAGATS